MANRKRSYSRQFLSPDAFPPAVKWLLIANVSIYILMSAVRFSGGPARWYSPLVLQPASVVTVGTVWQLVTYSFLHGDAQHIFWNALTFWMFGSMLERTWGTRYFLKFYFLCVVGAAVFTIIGSYLFFHNPTATFMGMSGGALGLVVAFGFVYYGQTMMFNFVFPIKAQYVAMLLAAFWFFMTLDYEGAFLTHLGGMATAFVYLYFFDGKDVKLKAGSTLSQKYKDWKADRARKKFQVYMKKNNPDRDRWVN